MASGPVRSDGWEDVLAACAQALFTETAERHGLRYECDTAAPVGVAVTYPVQRALDFALSLCLSGDEFGCGGEYWYATICPADDDENWRIISRLVDGLVTGEARVALYTAWGRQRPFWTEVQLFDGKKWKSASTGLGCAFPPLMRPTILQNGTEPQQGN